jgi:hypothetical protein
MKIRSEDIIVEEKTPFANCKLEREKYADVLTSLISKYDDGFVLAINNKWGYGKTTFLKMWVQKLINLEFETIYFNAWENDFENNPFTAILSELNQKIGSKSHEKFKSILVKASRIITSAVPSIAEHLAKKYLGISHIEDLTSDIAASGIEIFQTEIEDYISRKKSIDDFRKELENYLSEEDFYKRPLVFFIDELDRCRPSYAVEVLENIKHLFSVKGIVFVLSIDKEQLGYAVKGVYGSAEINSDEYLRRFIDLEYSLPDPNIEQFCKFLFEKSELKLFFDNRNRNHFGDEKETFLNLAYLFLNQPEISLRQVEKIFNHSTVAINSFGQQSYIFPNLFLYLVSLKAVQPETYNSILKKEFSYQEILDSFYQSIRKIYNEKSENSLILLQSQLLYFYKNYCLPYSGLKDLIEVNNNLNHNQLILNYPNHTEKGELNTVKYLKLFDQNHDINNFSLGKILNNIELTEAFKK